MSVFINLSFKKPKLSFPELRLTNRRLLEFDDFWRGFSAETNFYLWPQLINKYCQKQKLTDSWPLLETPLPSTSC